MLVETESHLRSKRLEVFFEKPSGRPKAMTLLESSAGIRGKLMAKTEKEIEAIEELAFKAAQDYVKAKNITGGLTKKAHAGCMVNVLVDMGLLDEAGKEEAFFALCKLENGSQLRQELEKAGTLTKAALAQDYI